MPHKVSSLLVIYDILKTPFEHLNIDIIESPTRHYALTIEDTLRKFTKRKRYLLPQTPILFLSTIRNQADDKVCVKNLQIKRKSENKFSSLFQFIETFQNSALLLKHQISNKIPNIRYQTSKIHFDWNQ